MDVFIEQIVKKKWNNTDYLKVTGIIVGGIVLFIVLNYVAMILGFQIWLMLFTICDERELFLIR